MRRLYEYKCRKCGVIFTELVEEADRTVGCDCRACGGYGDYMISSPYFKEDIMSERWVKNRESHMKQERKNLRNHGTYK